MEPKAVPAEVIGTVLGVAAAHWDKALFDAYLAQAKKRLQICATGAGC